MPDPLVDAVRAYERAVAGIDEARVRAEKLIDAAKARADDKRRALADAIVQAGLAGRRTRDVVAITGYTRERVRQIQRAGGVEPE